MSSPSSSTAPFRFREIADNLWSGPVNVSAADSALVVIDAQNFYMGSLGGDWPVDNILETNKVIVELVNKYRKAGGEIIWVAHTNDATLTPSDIKGTPMAIIDGLGFDHDDFKREKELFLSKAHGSSFKATPLHDYLQKKGIKNIVLAGYQPQFCVVTTAVYGHHLGYHTFVVRDALGSHNLKSWDDKREVKGRDLVDSACDLLSDALTVVIKSDDIKA